MGYIAFAHYKEGEKEFCISYKTSGRWDWAITWVRGFVDSWVCMKLKWHEDTRPLTPELATERFNAKRKIMEAVSFFCVLEDDNDEIFPIALTTGEIDKSIIYPTGALKYVLTVRDTVPDEVYKQNQEDIYKKYGKHPKDTRNP